MSTTLGVWQDVKEALVEMTQASAEFMPAKVGA